MHDIITKQDIDFLVDTFYQQVMQDELLSSFFENIHFEEHKPSMVHFWCFVLLNEPGYKTNVTEKHLHMQLEARHFERWMHYFNETIDAHFSGEKAEMAKQRAAIIGWTIQQKLAKK